MDKFKNLLLSGVPGVGKTTIIKKIIEEFGDKCAGFWTEELREKNRRRGFILKTTSDKECILADINFNKRYCVGKYGIDLDCIEDKGIEVILKGLYEKKIIIIDEIGKMELLSNRFKDLILKVLNSENTLIATILYYPNYFCDIIKKREDVKIYEVDYSNRENIKDKIINDLKRLNLI